MVYSTFESMLNCEYKRKLNRQISNSERTRRRELKFFSKYLIWFTTNTRRLETREFINTSVVDICKEENVSPNQAFSILLLSLL